MKKGFLVVLIFFSLSLTAQDLVYTTFAAKGTCVVQRGENPDEYVAVKSGVPLFLHDVVIVTGPATYISLVGVDGHVLEITHSGVYRIAELADVNYITNVSFAGKYAKLLLSPDSLPAMTLASVTRGGEAQSTISIEYPKESKFFQENLPVSWESSAPIASYTVAVCDQHNAHIYTQQTSNQQLDLELATLNIEPGAMYTLMIADGSNKENLASTFMQNATRAEVAEVETDLRMLRQELPQNAAITHMVLATYFETNGYYLNALKYYQLAVETEPDIVEYQLAYTEFLERMGIAN